MDELVREEADNADDDNLADTLEEIKAISRSLIWIVVM
jgi:hypothetical protein